MTDTVLLPAAFGGQAPADDVAVIPGWGPIPDAEARAHIAALLDHSDAELTRGADANDNSGAFVWSRRVFTDPSGRDLVALDSKRRLFLGGLRRFLELRDPTCRVPWCDAPAVEADHVHAVHDATAPPILGEGWQAPARIGDEFEPPDDPFPAGHLPDEVWFA